MKRFVSFTFLLSGLWSLAYSETTCVESGNDLDLRCDAHYIVAVEATWTTDCSDPSSSYPDTKTSDDVIRARCNGVNECHVDASDRSPGGLSVAYSCKAVSGSHVECYSHPIDEQLCFGNTTIEITGATYGVSPCYQNIGNCCPQAGDCTISVEEAAPDYYNEILEACNNKQSCEGLIAQWIANIFLWCPGNNASNSDYVTLHYSCVTAQ